MPRVSSDEWKTKNMTEITLPPMESVPISQLKVDGKNPNKMTREQEQHY